MSANLGATLFAQAMEANSRMAEQTRLKQQQEENLAHQKSLANLSALRDLQSDIQKSRESAFERKTEQARLLGSQAAMRGAQAAPQFTETGFAPYAESAFGEVQSALAQRAAEDQRKQQELAQSLQMREAQREQALAQTGAARALEQQRLQSVLPPEVLEEQRRRQAEREQLGLEKTQEDIKSQQFERRKDRELLDIQKSKAAEELGGRTVPPGFSGIKGKEGQKFTREAFDFGVPIFTGLDEIKNAVKTSSLRDRLTPAQLSPLKSRINSIAKDLQLALKGPAYGQLGALSGPDLDLMNSLATGDPLDPLTRPSTVLSQLEGLEERVLGKLMIKAQNYGGTFNPDAFFSTVRKISRESKSELEKRRGGSTPASQYTGLENLL